jgi:hypothetical protein
MPGNFVMRLFAVLSPPPVLSTMIHIRIQRQIAGFYQAQSSHGGDYLADRTGLKEHNRRDGIRLPGRTDAIAPRPRQLLLMDDGKTQTGNLRKSQALVEGSWIKGKPGGSSIHRSARSGR